MKKIILFTFSIIAITLSSCTDLDDTPPIPKLIIKFKFDPTQVRLNNLGQPVTVPVGNGAQTPIMNGISAHYFELAQNELTQFGNGTIVYQGPETSQGGSIAIDFSQAKIAPNNEVFIEIPLKDIKPDLYQYMRTSLSYQNLTIKIRYQNEDILGTLASFIGSNTYIGTHSVGTTSFPVNENKLQGYWAFSLNDFDYSTSGQAPATTVPNPIAATSAIPSGSCVVTGKFQEPLEITGLETRSIEVTLSLSINKSIEWSEVTLDNKYQPSAGETIVDMGIRGMIPTYKKL